MNTRLLTIWDMDESGNPAEKYREQYIGDYFERYKSLHESWKKKCPEWKELRIGFILDDRTGRVAVFRQLVNSRDDNRPTDILMGPGKMKAGEDVLEAGSTDPLNANPPERQSPCYVCDFTEREPTDEEKKMLAHARSTEKPPTEADMQCWRKKEEAKQRRAKAEEALIQLAKLHVAPPAPASTAIAVIGRVGIQLDSIEKKIDAEGKNKEQKEKEFAAMQEANEATSAEFKKAVGQIVRELPHPLGLVYDLYMNHNLSQDGIVKELSRRKISGCRTKKRIGELICEIKEKFKARGYPLKKKVTGRNPCTIGKAKSFNKATGKGTNKAFDEATGKYQEVDEDTPDKIVDRNEMEGIVERYKKATPSQKKEYLAEYPELAEALKKKEF